MEAQGGNAAFVVNQISNTLLGKIGGILALLGVVAAPITSGDTAFRSARLIIADIIKNKQGPIVNRLLISAPLFLVAFVLTRLDFSIIWRYFAWSNQVLATVVLWTITAFLLKEKKFYFISLVPAVFMTAVTTSYILIAPEGFGLPASAGQLTGAALAAVLLLYTLVASKKKKKPGLVYGT
jgi:carbon starvation protein CstA